MKEYCIWGGRQRKWRRGSCFSFFNQTLSPTTSRITGWLFFFPASSACFGASGLSCQLEVQQVGKGQHLHLSGWVDSAALVFCSQSRRHPASVPCASCRSCCQWQWTSQSSQRRRCGKKGRRHKVSSFTNSPSAARKQRRVTLRLYWIKVCSLAHITWWFICRHTIPVFLT